MLKPGRELDALVAEKVFRCQVRPGDPEAKSVVARFPYCGCEGADHSDVESQMLLIRPYSEDLSTAWGIVDKLGGVFIKGPDANGLWCAEIKGARFWTKSVPYSICLAALKACGVKEIPSSRDVLVDVGVKPLV